MNALRRLVAAGVPVVTLAAAPASAAPAATAPQTPPFSEAVRAGGFVYPSGQLGLDSGALVPGGIEAEARQALGNLRAVLARNGASLEDVVRCTVYLADMGDWAAFNRVYRQFFREPFPARTAVGVGALAFGARVELECLAYRGVG